ncbi:histone H3 [Lasius niger]|uniref:Histone H3 n=1 Tax=Lasius niger TaxID=67767 RepID=A0A0J7MYX7_LASNI|nr:histone H3 [Lasius niger]
MDQIRHKCGYCGWLFNFTTNFIDHNCFKYYTEEDHINVDENYVVTIVKNNPTVDKKEHLNELLIEAVRSKRSLYDFRVPASERSILRKNALWMEVSNILRGSLSPEEAKARWKYLRDNYIKARRFGRTTVSSLTDAKNDEVVTSLDRGNEQYEGDAVAGPSTTLQISHQQFSTDTDIPLCSFTDTDTHKYFFTYTNTHKYFFTCSFTNPDTHERFSMDN